jgi:gliding motility-associated-like protein
MPNIEIVVGDYSGCTPIHVDFEEKSGNPKFNCNWVFDDESIRGVRKVSKTYNKVGTHKVSLMVTNDFGCRDTATAEVTVYEKPYAAFNILTKGTLYIGDTATFINKSTRSVRYNWDLADGDYSQSKDTLKKYLSPGQHPVTLWAYNANGCADSVTKYVDVRVKPWIYVPNAFTPDGNGLNDNFEVQSEYITQFEILILNRWGEIIYRSNDVNFKWDGTYLGDPVPGGVYVYKIFARDYYDVAIPLKGDVTVLK